MAGLDAELDDAQIKIRTSDHNVFSVSAKVANQSELLRVMIEGDKLASEYRVSVPFDMMSRAIQFMEHYADEKPAEIPRPLPTTMKQMTDIVPEFDAKLVDVPNDVLLDIVRTANYLDMRPYIELACAKVAFLIRGKTPEQITKEIFPSSSSH